MSIKKEYFDNYTDEEVRDLYHELKNFVHVDNHTQTLKDKVITDFVINENAQVGSNCTRAIRVLRILDKVIITRYLKHHA